MVYKWLTSSWDFFKMKEFFPHLNSADQGCFIFCTNKSAFGLHVFRFLKSEDFPIICIVEKIEEIPWCPVVRTLSFHCSGFDPWPGRIKILHAAWCGKKKKKKKKPKEQKRKIMATLFFLPVYMCHFPSYLYVPVKELIMYCSPLVNNGKKEPLQHY